MIGVEEVEDIADDTYPANGPQIAQPKKRGRPKGSGTPSAPKSPPYQEYVQPIAKALVGLSLVAVLVQGNPGWIMATQEGDAIAKPLAKLFAKSSLARHYGRYIAQSNDYISLAMAVGQYGKNAMERSNAYASMVRGTSQSQPTRPVSATHQRSKQSGTDSSVDGSNHTGSSAVAADGLPIVTVDLSTFSELTPGRGD